MSPKEVAADVGRTIQQFNPLRAAVTWSALVFIVGTSVGMFVRSPAVRVKEANAARDTAIARLQRNDAAQDVALRIIATELPAIKCYLKALYAGEPEQATCGLEQVK